MPDKIRATRIGASGSGGGGGRIGVRSRRTGIGLGVDQSGGPVIDPTENVIALTEAANKRQDDLRDLNNDRINAEIAHVKEMAELRAEHSLLMSAAEANRLNSIRQVDVLAVNTAADRALSAIQTLAATTTSNAENLRSALTSTATAIAVQTANTVSAINERLAALEKSSYEGKGKQAYADPMMAELVNEMKNLREARANVSGKSEGIGSSWGVLLGAVSLIATLITIGAFIFTRPHQAEQPAQPSVIYVPSPTGTMLPTQTPSTGTIPR